VYWFPKAFDLFDFPVDALRCTRNQKPLETSTPKSINRKAKKIKSLWKPVHQRASTGKPNKSKAFGN
jgi:restriction endonuclease